MKKLIIALLIFSSSCQITAMGSARRALGNLKNQAGQFRKAFQAPKRNLHNSNNINYKPKNTLNPAIQKPTNQTLNSYDISPLTIPLLSLGGYLGLDYYYDNVIKINTQENIADAIESNDLAKMIKILSAGIPENSYLEDADSSFKKNIPYFIKKRKISPEMLDLILSFDRQLYKDNKIFYYLISSFNESSDLLDVALNHTIGKTVPSSVLETSLKLNHNENTIKKIIQKGDFYKSGKFTHDEGFIDLAIQYKASPEVVRLLIEAGANPNKQYYSFTPTPLSKAIEMNAPEEILEMLKEAGARTSWSNYLKSWFK